MSQVIARDGFVADQWSSVTLVEEDAYAGGPALLIAPDTDPAQIAAHFPKLALIVIPFGSSADGRGFSLAAQMRALGYRGHLRARGHILVDQFRAALRSGFDDIEISDAQADRNPEAQWLSVPHGESYRTRLLPLAG